ncbi:MAG: Minichromosome maintenance protein MCM [Thermoprotei archaeon]|nr:MAG: Minichromosome maintenance protein MCM [Thermoprotei archaeon]
MTEITEATLDPRQKFIDFFKTFQASTGEYKYRDRIGRMAAANSISLVIDFEDILAIDAELASLIVERPRYLIPEASKAILDVMKVENPEYAASVDHFIARFKGLPEIVPLRKVRAVHINRLIALDGIVTRISPVKQQLIEAVFQCTECGEEVIVPQTGKGVTAPKICPVCSREEGKKRSTFDLKIEKCKFIDWQKMILQERPDELPPGQLPRSIEIIVTEDLVDVARPGDRAIITGILSVEPERSSNREGPPIFKTFVEANYIDVMSKETYDVEITVEDEKRILELAKLPDIRDRIISSIAPSIHGYREIKEAVACLLFGGEPKIFPDGVRTRGDIHVLLVGDPGTGKSQILRYVATIAPRAVYTTGKGSTAAGLTAAVVRERRTGEFYLEAGALVLTDGGVACIDEFDKMDPRDRVSIHEAMEQQTISIAKAGIVATLNARASVLAAANPAFGRYIRQRTIAENIDLPVTILSRFDLIFVITDVPNAESDRSLAEHVVGLHSGDYSEKFRNLIPPELLKKYVAYARRYIHPRLSEEAKQKIIDFYTEMRARGEDPNSPIAITPRQLEALIRLAEAHAKMALKTIVTEEDAEAAIRLMMCFLQGVGLDTETKSIDIDIVMTGKPMSQREKLIKLIDILRELEKESSNGMVKVQELLDRAASQGLDKEFVEKALQHLRKEGEIFEPRPGYVKKT